MILQTAELSRSTEQIPVETYAELAEDRINCFLSSTHMVLGSVEYSQLHVFFGKNLTYSWTPREWGHMIADWANRTNWLGHQDWNYLDFYGGLNDRVVENYNEWSEAAMRVIKAKSNTNLT